MPTRRRRAGRSSQKPCYRLWWDLGEICWYVTLLRQVHDDDADIRESWHNLEHYLDPAGRWPELVQNR